MFLVARIIGIIDYGSNYKLFFDFLYKVTALVKMKTMETMSEDQYENKNRRLW